MTILFASCGSEIALPGDDNLTSTDNGNYSPTPDWVGVYENKNGMVAVLEYENDMCRFVVDITEDGGSGYLTGYANVDGSEAVFTTENFSMTMKLVNDTLTLSQEGDNPYVTGSAEFSGTFSRSDKDPATIVPNGSESAAELPEGLTSTTQNGVDVYSYLDPDNRYSVILPNIGANFPSDKQPKGGVYISSSDGAACIYTEYTEKVGAMSSTELQNYLADTYGRGASSASGGMVIYSYTFTDENKTEKTDEVYAMSIGKDLLTVHFVYDTSMKSTYSGYGDIISIGAG